MNTAEHLSRLIQDIPGVTALYPADPAWQRTAAGIADAITGASRPPDLTVALSTDGAATNVQVSIGVDPASPAPAVARRVAAAIRRELATTPPPSTAPPPTASMEVTVRISRIAPRNPHAPASTRSPKTPGDTKEARSAAPAPVQYNP